MIKWAFLKAIQGKSIDKSLFNYSNHQNNEQGQTYNNSHLFKIASDHIEDHSNCSGCLACMMNVQCKGEEPLMKSDKNLFNPRYFHSIK